MKLAAARLLLVMALAAQARGQGPPTARVQNCTTSGCHAQQLEHKFLHGPTAIQSCDSCHEYQDAATHHFLLKRTGAELCTFCHIDKTGKEEKFVHEPVAKGDCTGCHDPHGSNVRQMLKRDSVVQTCTACHKNTLAHPNVHKPAGEMCTACHKPHSASHEKLLTMDRQALCISCHEQVGSTAKNSTHQHKPATEDCTKCHTPHSSDNIRILKAAPADLCVSCHEQIGKQASSATHPHGAITDARSCLNCHVPHGSDHAKQLSKDPVGACLECHKKPIRVNDERTVGAVAEIVASNAHLHGPIEQGDCAGCHTVHGGDQNKLLVHPYAPGFYLPFSTESYALCFSCHDSRLAESESSDGGTGFRNGTRNLHWVHVAKSPQGRSCRACHTPHAGHNDVLIADSVTFGQWKLPINYKSTPTGGSCAPGCHKPETYDRSAGGASAGKAPVSAKPRVDTPAFIGPPPETPTPGVVDSAPK